MTCRVETAYDIARERYAHLGVDTDAALAALDAVSLSLHCWQGDDVAGFETAGSGLQGGGIAVTGSYPGRARDIGELRQDLDQVYRLLPGTHRLNLHAIYGDFEGRRVDRDAIEPGHYASWIDWAKQRGLGLDFNATCFSHPKAADGYTLAHRDPHIRAFWQEHVRRCRSIAAHMGRELGTPGIHNLWIPDGDKETTVNRLPYRQCLKESLDIVYGEHHDAACLKDSVESKLFGLGSESFVVGSHDFYLAWALQNDIMLCMDIGHYHPTESVADKISALLPFFNELMLHVTRGVRWDSDHVVTFGDEVRNLMEEIVRAGALNRVHLALDYFDASLNRVGAWAIGARSTLKALLFALLEPTAIIRSCEENNDGFGRLAFLEDAKTLPFGAVWEYHLHRNNVPGDGTWLEEVRRYENEVQSKR